MEIKNNKHYDFLKLLDNFIKDTKTGKRKQAGGKKIRNSSSEQYIWLRKSLYDFSIQKNFPLHISNLNKIKKRELNTEEKYWKKFYDKFTDYLYDDLDCYDNYVGNMIKLLRAFFTYLNKTKKLNIGSFHSQFYVCQEDIEIVTLLPEQVNFLIYNKEFENSLPEHLKRTKDMFVFGCTVALRNSDIFRISKSNIHEFGNKTYLSIHSQKTNTHTRVLLPDYAVAILKKYSWDKITIFPKISNAQFNINIKNLIERTNWVDGRTKMRTKRGIPVEVYKNPKTKESYRFCDLITTHTMRRTAITNMLSLNMPENMVRKISGHAANSKEFYKYVQLSQKYMDDETEKLHEKFKVRQLTV